MVVIDVLEKFLNTEGYVVYNCCQVVLSNSQYLSFNQNYNEMDAERGNEDLVQYRSMKSTLEYTATSRSNILGETFAVEVLCS